METPRSDKGAKRMTFETEIEINDHMYPVTCYGHAEAEYLVMDKVILHYGGKNEDITEILKLNVKGWNDLEADFASVNDDMAVNSEPEEWVS